ncbi:dicarboxylate/amino acid:cation symporter [Nocardiopsis sp. EMB25]|uniref:dicarboxylate/amino acid:cation symporter n=1 Tax=Nocardiopsis sp. EMB25 TaxID=2835867 RepID=UPI002284CF38|nr:dicarboxylate/amino acid:cation symporter [Nocardiopsis sp. EMB25]MCY9783709.1 dicarboxylate/amino acid:cation symporter [Nocardiopsis sp. EMB25]
MSTTTPSAPRSPWRRYLDIPLIWKMAVALTAGVAFGLAANVLGWQDWALPVLEPLGELFLRLLRMLILPLIITTLIAGVASLSPQRLGRIGLKVLAFYLVTSALAMTVGVALAMAVSPGSGLDAPEQGQAAPEPTPVTEVLLDIVPADPFQALAEGNVLAVMFGAIVAGLALAFMLGSGDDRVRESGLLLKRVVDGAVELVFKVVHGVLEYAPVGVFALIAAVLAETGTEVIVPLLRLTAVVYGAILVQIIAYVLILALFRAPLTRFFTAAKDPMLTAFVTRSSSGTLPVTTQAARRMGVREGVYGFSLPLGATINMDGTAIYVGAATVFVANIAGVQLSLGQLLTVVLVGVLASVGTAGVPGAGLVMLSMAVTSVGLPLAPVGWVAGIDAILDMGRTMCNVTGDLTATRVVAGTERGMLGDPDGFAHSPGGGSGADDEPVRDGPDGPGAGTGTTDERG